MKLTETEIQTLPHFIDDRGILLPIEFENLPFLPQRMFIVTHVGSFKPQERIRGMHANKVCQQFFYVISGEVEISLFDGYKKRKYLMYPGQGIFIDKMIWNSYLARTVHGQTNNYVVVASHPYDENDYIRDLEEFKKQVTENTGE